MCECGLPWKGDEIQTILKHLFSDSAYIYILYLYISGFENMIFLSLSHFSSS